MSADLSRELLAFNPSWPPAVIIRRRSSRISLRIDNAGGLRVNAPSYVSQREIKAFIVKNQDWLDKQRVRSDQVFQQLNGSELGEYVTIQHKVTPTTNISARTDVLKLAHPASFSDWASLYEQGRDTIKRLVNKQAKLHLLPEAEALASELKKTPSTIRVRYMRSRWGSCHPNGVITLNSQLIRLPQQLRRYVICHELTHLQHHHHQASFWTELESAVGPVKVQRQQLRRHNLWY